MRQSVNLAKTKVVTFGSRASCQAFKFNGSEVERAQSYRYLGFEQVTKLVSATMLNRMPFAHFSCWAHLVKNEEVGKSAEQLQDNF